MKAASEQGGRETKKRAGRDPAVFIRPLNPEKEIMPDYFQFLGNVSSFCLFRLRYVIVVFN